MSIQLRPVKPQRSLNTHPQKTTGTCMSELVTDERTEDAGDECKTKDVGINSALPVIEQLEGRIAVCVCVCVCV